MATLNFHHLRLFRAIAHEGSLTRAAERLHLSQSSLSVQLKTLEAQLGHPLFERIGRRLVLTEAGQIALDYADTVFTTGEELLSTLEGRAPGPRQILRIGALTTLSRNFQLQVLRPLIGRKDVELIVRSGTLSDLLAQLRALQLDILLTNRPVLRDATTPWRNHLLNEQPVSLVGSPDWAPFRFPEDLETVPILLPSLESHIRVAFDAVLERAGVRPIIQAEVDDMAMLRLLARESGAVTLVPSVVVRDELASGVLKELCKLEAITEPFYAVVLERRFPNPLVRSLLASLEIKPSQQAAGH